MPDGRAALAHAKTRSQGNRASRSDACLLGFGPTNALFRASLRDAPFGCGLSALRYALRKIDRPRCAR